MKRQMPRMPVVILSAIILVTLGVIFSTRKQVKDKPRLESVVSTATSNRTFRVRPLRTTRYEPSAVRLKQGEYLTNGILQCFTCHSPRNWKAPGAPPIAGKIGSGGTIVNEDSTSLVVAPNITPDKETGAGNWTDDMFARAIREGIGHDGRALTWQMPFYFFRNLSDEDLASVIVYLRSLPPVHNKIPQTRMPIEQRSEMEKWIGLIPSPY